MDQRITNEIFFSVAGISNRTRKFTITRTKGDCVYAQASRRGSVEDFFCVLIKELFNETRYRTALDNKNKVSINMFIQKNQEPVQKFPIEIYRGKEDSLPSFIKKVSYVIQEKYLEVS